MALPLSLKTATRWLFSFYRAARKIRNCLYYLLRSTSRPAPAPQQAAGGRTVNPLLLNFPASLLRTASHFPFFMVVAFEGSGPLRALFLLLSYPLILLLRPTSQFALKVMVFITFCGMSCKKMDIVVRAVLSKVYMDELDRKRYEAAAAVVGRKVVVSNMPKVMVKKFAEECFGANEVFAPELETIGGRYFTGRFTAGGSAAEVMAAVNNLRMEEEAVVPLVNMCSINGHLPVPCSREVRAVTTNIPATEDSSAANTTGVDEQSASGTTFQRDKYLKPLIFHDGRLAFLPSPAATLSLLLWLPFALILSVVRILIGVLLPYQLSLVVGATLGVTFRVRLSSHNQANRHRGGTGVLFVCTHRTLLDPIFLSHALARPIPVVTYSLSRFSESISPIPTVRLTRDRHGDAETMLRLLEAGDLAVCPEGTTCRERYLLRFSPLFAELGVDIEPVALNAECTMFYATTATGMKSLDPLFFFMNPRPAYQVSFLGRVPKEMTIAGGWTAAEVANRIQRELAKELGFECTALTRRDKYILLARNDGVVASPLPEKY